MTPTETIVPGGPGYVYVIPPTKLSDKVRRINKPGFNPILAAENYLNRMSAEFSFWLLDEEKNLRRAQIAFVKDPGNKDAFTALNEAIHAIKGNAPILGCEAAGLLATPLATAIENCTDHKNINATFDLVITAICAALRGDISAKDPATINLVSTLDKMNSNCRMEKSRTRQSQAAGKASNCST